MRIQFGHATVWRRDNALVFPIPNSVLRYTEILARFACDVPEDSSHRQQIAHSNGGEYATGSPATADRGATRRATPC